MIALLSLASCSGGKPVPKPAPTGPKAATTPTKPATGPGFLPESKNVAWLDSERLMPVLELAQREKKPVFVEFYASWCLPCKVMEENLFTQAPVSKYLNDHFLSFRTDFDSPAGRTIADIYAVDKLPTVLFLDPNGVVAGRYTGVPTLTTLMQQGDLARVATKK